MLLWLADGVGVDVEVRPLASVAALVPLGVWTAVMPAALSSTVFRETSTSRRNRMWIPGPHVALDGMWKRFAHDAVPDEAA
jgi:hypothetical protein